ncbi:MAG: hypothetical protein V3V36_00350 [Candidatus Hydrothermarchaeaceae archaeon]
MYKIPKNEEIADAIRRVLKRNKEVNSQVLFHKLVLKELKRKSPYYTASSERIKKTAALEGVKIFVEKRKSSKEAKTCFICGGALETLRVKNLLGEEASAGKKCKVCGFRMDRGNLVPRRYTFYV